MYLTIKSPESTLQEDLSTLDSKFAKEKVDAEAKVSIYDVANGKSAQMNGDQIGWAASIIKLPVMVATLQQVDAGNLSLDTKLRVDHRYTLERGDFVSTLPNGYPISVLRLLYHMIVASDNEATNLLADKIGVPVINQSMEDLGLRQTMLGHLLCPGVPRYTSSFNQDGSNVTTPNDMVTLMRHLYDPSFSQLSKAVREEGDFILSETCTSPFFHYGFRYAPVKSKIGLIHDRKDGEDMHEAGVVTDNLLICLMLNKINQKRSKMPRFGRVKRVETFQTGSDQEFFSDYDQFSAYMGTSPFRVGDRVLDVIVSHITAKK